MYSFPGNQYDKHSKYIEFFMSQDENLENFSDSDESCDQSESSSSSTSTESWDSDQKNMLEEPYQDEPLASESDEDEDRDEDLDVDGLRPSTLEARFEGQSPVIEW